MRPTIYFQIVSENIQESIFLLFIVSFGAVSLSGCLRQLRWLLAM